MSEIGKVGVKQTVAPVKTIQPKPVQRATDSTVVEKEFYKLLVAYEGNYARIYEQKHGKPKAGFRYNCLFKNNIGTTALKKLKENLTPTALRTALEKDIDCKQVEIPKQPEPKVPWLPGGRR